MLGQQSAGREWVKAELQNYCYTAEMVSKVTLNDRGVITIPASLRQAYGLKANDELILEGTEAGILLRPSVSVPLEIYTEARIAEFARDEAAIGKLLPKARPAKAAKARASR